MAGTLDFVCPVMIWMPSPLGSKGLGLHPRTSLNGPENVSRHRAVCSSVLVAGFSRVCRQSPILLGLGAVGTAPFPSAMRIEG